MEIIEGATVYLSVKFPARCCTSAMGTPLKETAN